MTKDKANTVVVKAKKTIYITELPLVNLSSYLVS